MKITLIRLIVSASMFVGLFIPQVHAGTITVNAGGDLQAALNAAQPGDTISLQAGVTYTGNFVLPVKTGSTSIIVTTGGVSTPAPGVRVKVADAASFAKIVTVTNQPAIRGEPGSHHWTFQLLELTTTWTSSTATQYGLASFGIDAYDNQATTLAQLPHHIVFDRVYVHGTPTGSIRRGIMMDAINITVKNSYISEIHEVGADSQALVSWNGAGPFLIDNNYLEGAGENVMFGGSDAFIPNLVPSNITVTNNYFFKPLSWVGGIWSVKNIFELKNAQDVLIEHNLFENNWVAGQNGFAIVFTNRNQDGRNPWSVVQRVVFQNNILKNVANAFNITGYDNNFQSVQDNNLVMRNNLIIGLGFGPNGAQGRLAQISNGPKNVTIDHNTAIASITNSGLVYLAGSFGPQSWLPAGAPQTQGLVYTNNLMKKRSYGVIGDSIGEGTAALNLYTVGGYVFQKNVLSTDDTSASSLYPSTTLFPTDGAFDSNFVNPNGGNYTLVATSPYKNAATDGTDIGVNMAPLAGAGTNTGTSPSPTPLPPPPTPTPPPLPPPPTSSTINLNPSTKYQKMTGWEVAVLSTWVDNSPYLPVMDSVLDYLVNEMGVTRVRLESTSGDENPTDYGQQFLNRQITEGQWVSNGAYNIINDNSDPNVINPNGFHFTLIDWNMDNIVMKMRQKVLARGEQFYINIDYVDFGASSFEHYNNPEEYAEHMLALFQHMQSKYGVVPNGIEVILEPDNVSGWSGTAIGKAIVATAQKLQANGFAIPEFIAPSTTVLGNAPIYFDQIKAVPGALQYLKEISYHRYDTSGNLQDIADRAIQNNKNTSMLEWWTDSNDYQILHQDLTTGRNSSWQQSVIVSSNLGHTYVNVSGSTVVPSLISKFTRQYMKYVRPGAERIQATSVSSSFAPLAFVNTNGKYVVVVKAAAGGSFGISGLPVGTYGIFYTTSSNYNINLSDVTLSSGQVLNTNIPSAGVITIYAKTTSGTIPAPVPPPSPAPTLGLGATPNSVTPGSTSTLKWSTTNATSCTASGAWSGSKAISGSQTIIPSTTGTYTLSCTGSGGTITNSVTVTVTSTPSPVSSKFKVGDSTQVSANLNVRGDPSTTGTILGMQTLGSLGTVTGGPTTAGGYSWWNINYNNIPDGWSVEDFLNLYITSPSPVPSAGLVYVTPTTANFGSVDMGSVSSNKMLQFFNTSPSFISTINLSITGDYSIKTNYCNNGAVPNSHCDVYVAFTPTATGQRTGTLTFTETNVSSSPQVIQLSGEGAGTNPLLPALTFSASPTIISPGTSSVLSWSSTNSNSCMGSGDWGDPKQTTGSQTVSPTANATYTLSCTGSSGTITKFVTVTVPSGTPNAGNKFIIGDRVYTNVKYLNVRATPYGKRLGFQRINSKGTVKEGPVLTNGTYWWKVDWDIAPTGWSSQTYLSKVIVTEAEKAEKVREIQAQLAQLLEALKILLGQ